jgi:hypothetical protein
MHHVMHQIDFSMPQGAFSNTPYERRRLFWIGDATAQQMAISVFRHPFCAGQVAVERRSCTSGFKSRINMEHKPGDLAPIRTFAVSVEQAQIGDDVLLVVSGQGRIYRRQVGNVRIERRFFHGFLDANYSMLPTTFSPNQFEAANRLRRYIL